MSYSERWADAQAWLLSFDQVDVDDVGPGERQEQVEVRPGGRVEPPVGNVILVINLSDAPLRTVWVRWHEGFNRVAVIDPDGLVLAVESFSRVERGPWPVHSWYRVLVATGGTIAFAGDRRVRIFLGRVGEVLVESGHEGWVRVVDVDGQLVVLRRRDRLVAGESLLGDEVASTVGADAVARGESVTVDEDGYADTPDGRVLVGAFYHDRPVLMVRDGDRRIVFDPEAGGLVLAELDGTGGGEAPRVSLAALATAGLRMPAEYEGLPFGPWSWAPVAPGGTVELAGAPGVRMFVGAETLEAFVQDNNGWVRVVNRTEELVLRRRDRLVAGESLLGDEVAPTVGADAVARGESVTVDEDGYSDTPDGRVLVGAFYHDRPVLMLRENGRLVVFDPWAGGLVLAELVATQAVVTSQADVSDPVDVASQAEGAAGVSDPAGVASPAGGAATRSGVDDHGYGFTAFPGGVAAFEAEGETADSLVGLAVPGVFTVVVDLNAGGLPVLSRRGRSVAAVLDPVLAFVSRHVPVEAGGLPVRVVSPQGSVTRPLQVLTDRVNQQRETADPSGGMDLRLRGGELSRFDLDSADLWSNDGSDVSDDTQSSLVPVPEWLESLRLGDVEVARWARRVGSVVRFGAVSPLDALVEAAEWIAGLAGMPPVRVRTAVEGGARFDVVDRSVWVPVGSWRVAWSDLMRGLVAAEASYRFGVVPEAAELGVAADRVLEVASSGEPGVSLRSLLASLPDEFDVDGVRGGVPGWFSDAEHFTQVDPDSVAVVGRYWRDSSGQWRPVLAGGVPGVRGLLSMAAAVGFLGQLVPLAGMSEASAAVAGPRVVANYLAQFDPARPDRYVSPVHVVGAATDVVVGPARLAGDGRGLLISAADPEQPAYRQMWSDLATLQREGTRVLVKLEGFRTFRRLDRDFEQFYPMVEDLVRRHGLDGVDLDAGPQTPVAVVERLIRALRASFGDEFVVSVSFSSSELDAPDRAGMDVTRLVATTGQAISWLTMRLTPQDRQRSLAEVYQTRLRQAGVTPDRLVLDVATSDPAATVAGAPARVPLAELAEQVAQLRSAFPDLGGVAGTDYALALHDPTMLELLGEMPSWIWFRRVHAMLNPSRMLALEVPVPFAHTTAPFSGRASAFLRATTGLLAMEYPDGSIATGSAVVVDSPSGDLALTAAHNIYDPEHGGYARSVFFSPGHTPDSTPFGIWQAHTWEMVDGYTSFSPLDVAVVLLRPQQGRHIQQVVGGGQGVDFADRGRPGREIHALGYPAGEARTVEGTLYRGSTDVLWIGSSRMVLPGDVKEAGAGAIEPATPVFLTSGFSGGPWLADVDLHTGRGRIITVTSANVPGALPRDGQPWQRPHSLGAYFGEPARRLYEWYANVSEPPEPVVIANRGGQDATATVTTDDGVQRGSAVVPAWQTVTLQAQLEGWHNLTVAGQVAGRDVGAVPANASDLAQLTFELTGRAFFGFEFRAVDSAGVPIPDQRGDGFGCGARVG